MRVLGWTLGFWNEFRDPNELDGAYSSWANWHKRMQVFAPFELFIASGTWSEPSLCPLPGVKVVNAGATFTGKYEGHRRHYGICAFTGAMAYALNRNDWDLLVTLDTDALLGALDLPALFKEFMERPQIIMAPSWADNLVGGPLLVWKREGASRLLHNRSCSNLRDPDESGRELLWEHECSYIYRGDRWWNPWPERTTMLATDCLSDPTRAIREQWPMIGRPDPVIVEQYEREQTSKLIPLTNE